MVRYNMFRKQLLQLFTDTSVKTFHQGRNALLPLRSMCIDGFTLAESRQLWYAWLLYKYKTDQNVPDVLWASARTVILEAMRGNDIKEVANAYFTQFKAWKEEDLHSLTDEIAQYYFHVLELKQLIEQTANENTVAEWRSNYNALLVHIQSAAERIKCWDKVQERVAHLQQAQRSVVHQMLHRVFWDQIETDIRNEEYATVFCQLLELKQLMTDIIPVSFHSDLHEHLDMDFIKQRIDDKTFDDTFVLGLTKWVMEALQEWDSEDVRHLYDQEIHALYQSVEVLEWPVLLRTLLEVCTMLALDLKTRKAVWLAVIATNGSKK